MLLRHTPMSRYNAGTANLIRARSTLDILPKSCVSRKNSYVRCTYPRMSSHQPRLTSLDAQLSSLIRPFGLFPHSPDKVLSRDGGTLECNGDPGIDRHENGTSDRIPATFLDPGVATMNL